MEGAASSIKSQLKSLSDQRAALELEIAQRSGRLQAAGVGLAGSLVDSQGYPRADVDVTAIRGDRHAIITLTNDHKALTKQMELLLHQLHAQATLPSSAANSTAAGAGARHAAAAQQPPEAAAAGVQQANGAGNGHAATGHVAAAAEDGSAALPPFAVVDDITAGSPAAAAGLRLSDELCSFAGVTKQTPGTLQAVAAALQANEGRAVEAIVLRQGAQVTLQLTPQQWGGRGLLGCHLRPL